LPLLLICQLERSLPRWGKDTQATQVHSAQTHAVVGDIFAADRAREAKKFGCCSAGQSLQKRGASTRPTSVTAETREHSVRHGTGPTQRAPTVAAGRPLERWTRRTPFARNARCAVHGLPGPRGRYSACAHSTHVRIRGSPEGAARLISTQSARTHMHPRTPRRRGAHTVCCNSNRAGDTPPHAPLAD
jgi:hypothetical protein